MIHARKPKLITYREKGNILDDPSDVLVCTVNSIPGVMGAGQAKAFADRWPMLIGRHRQLVRDGLLSVKLGGAMTWEKDKSRSYGLLGIYLFPTKDHWKDPSQLSWIATGLDIMALTLAGIGNDPRHPELAMPIHSVALGALGCGLGGLAWRDVGPLIERAHDTVPHIHWTVYLPGSERK